MDLSALELDNISGQRRSMKQELVRLKEIQRLKELKEMQIKSQNNMQKLARFLGLRVSVDAEYPHVQTPSEHQGEKEPPEDEPDPNEDLWGEWNGGVPEGNFEKPADWIATLRPR